MNINNRRARRAQGHRRPYYEYSPERRAVHGVAMIKRGWTAQEAARVVGVNRLYLGVVKHLGVTAVNQLYAGQLTLCEVYKNYLRDLAERRVAREANRIADEFERVVRDVEPAILLNRIIHHHGSDCVLTALDQLTAPQLQLEAAE